MPASKTFVNYKSPVQSFEVANERFLGLIEPGRVRGFDEIFVTTPGLVFGISHELTGIQKVAKDGVTLSAKTGVLMTKQGTIAHFEDEIEALAVNTNAGGGAERIDVIYFQHSYQESTSPNLGIVGIQEGTPGAGEPALPVGTQMVKLGTITMPDNASAVLTTYYTPAYVPGIGNKQTEEKDTIIAQTDNLNDKRQEELYGFYESARTALPELLMWDGATLQKQERAILLSGLQIDESNAANTVVQPFYYYSNGKVCYFDGGTFDLDGALALMVYPSNTVLPGNPDLPWDVINESSTFISDVRADSIDSTTASYPVGVQAIILTNQSGLSVLGGSAANWEGNNQLSTIGGANFIFGGTVNTFKDPITGLYTSNSVDARIKAISNSLFTPAQHILTPDTDFTQVRVLRAQRSVGGTVSFDGVFSRTFNTGVSNTQVVAVLPEGFRPLMDCYWRGNQVSWDNNGYETAADNDFPTFVSYISVRTNGEVRVADIANVAPIGEPSRQATMTFSLQGICYAGAQ